jgi:hypothetical protein
MKSLFLLVIVLSQSAFAKYNFSCSGLYQDEPAMMSLTFENRSEVFIIDPQGHDITLDLTDGTQRNTIYGDYDFDGYGGSIELKLPKNFRISMDYFRVIYLHKVYSELGLTGTYKFSGECERE